MKSTHFTVPALLASLLLTGALLACSDAQDTSDTADDGVTPTTTADVTEVTDDSYSGNLEKQDFGGKVFRVAASNELSGTEGPTVQQFAIDDTGETVNDTLLARDLWIESSYNVDVQYTNSQGWDGTVYSNGVKAGDLPYECILQDSGSLTPWFSFQGIIYPLNMVDGIRLDADYWLPEMNQDLYVCGDLYLASCPITPRYWGSASVIMFNRDLANDIDLPNLYDSVLNGTWTLDQMEEYSKTAYRDVDGNSKWDENDIYGLIYEDCTPESLVVSADLRYMRSENGELKIMFDDADLVSFSDKLKEIFHAEYNLKDENQQLAADVHSNGNYLFHNIFTFTLDNYRDLTYDFGILPLPKNDEAQKEYYAYSLSYATTTPSVPVSTQPADLPFVGTIINAMTAYGYDYLRPAVFDNVIQLKGTRDEQSAKIIDLMFENITMYVPALSGSHFDSTMNGFFFSKTNTSNCASTFASIKDKCNADVEAIMETYRVNHDEFESSIGK